MATGGTDESILALRSAVDELKQAVSYVHQHRSWQLPEPSVSLPAAAIGWNFDTFEKYINQRFGDLSLQLRERYEAQQTGVTAALAAAEKAVNAALIAAEKAVDKAEGAHMWTIKEGQAAVDSLRRENNTALESLAKRLSILETAAANIQGRIWGVSALWAVLALAVSIGIRFIGR